VDTGAFHRLFERRHAELLNLDVEAGDPMAFRTAAGRVEAFGHLVTIETLGLNFESAVYFFADERINKNLLGRLGWLDRIRLGSTRSSTPTTCRHYVKVNRCRLGS